MSAELFIAINFSADKTESGEIAVKQISHALRFEYGSECDEQN